ncbi:MAG: indolepyruvate oxidoreductase subunit beta [Caldisericia bacterium]|jgi:indolepyruvate ferredoxin oxidoreductase beta subunit|nr:indolepyruvate oxidoreductase subunit beta [Caldisericia bacterium]
MNEFNILIVGVGGQGVLKLAEMICEVSLLENKNALMSEIHGMAQRGGSVFSEVRIGDVLSPIFEDGEGDLMISLEPSEVLRYIHKLKRNSFILINDSEIIPFTVSLGISSYPKKEEIYKSLKDLTDKLYIINGTKLLEEKSIAYTLNSFMFGVFSYLNPLNFSLDNFYKVLEDNFKGKNLELNKISFEFGREKIKEFKI